IRDFHVTGVQTCALPIYHIPKIIFSVLVLVYCMGPNNLWAQIYSCIRTLNKDDTHAAIEQVKTAFDITAVDQPQAFHQAFTRAKIGRASCRERVDIRMAE